MRFPVGTKFKTRDNRIATIISSEILPSTYGGDIVLYSVKFNLNSRSGLLISESVILSKLNRGYYTEIN